MESQKVKFYKRLTERIGKLGLDMGLEAAVKRMESKARSCYSEEFGDIISDEFMQMMVLDRVFIIELLRLYHKSTQVEEGTPVKEPIFATRWMLPNITRDLLALENQLPMFILDEIYLLTTFEDDPIPLKELTLLFFMPLRHQKGDEGDSKHNTRGRLHRHLPGLFHLSFVTREYRPSRSRSGARWNNREKLPGELWVHEARRLKTARIRLKNNPRNLLNVEFSKRELRIPTLFIDHCTGTVFRNLLAYEQCNAFAPYFTCYAIFLNSLIDQQAVREILQDAEIIMQSVGVDEQVVDLINNITKELVFDMHDCYIVRQIEDINAICRSWISKCISLLSRVGFISMVSSFIFPSLR